MKLIAVVVGLLALSPQCARAVDTCPTSSAQALKCADGVQKNLVKLFGAVAKCALKSADLSFKHKPFDEAACRNTATGKYDATRAKLLGHGHCPATLTASDQSALRDVVLAQVDSLDA